MPAGFHRTVPKGEFEKDGFSLMSKQIKKKKKIHDLVDLWVHGVAFLVWKAKHSVVRGCPNIKLGFFFKGMLAVLYNELYIYTYIYI